MGWVKGMKIKVSISIVFILTLLLVASTSISPQLAQPEVEQPLPETEETPSYEWFAEQIAQIERAQAQQLLNDTKALRAWFEAETEVVQARIGQEILNLQLQLVLVSLDGPEQAIVLERINQLHKELEDWEERAQVQFEQSLAELQLDHQLELQKTLAVLTSP